MAVGAVTLECCSIHRARRGDSTLPSDVWCERCEGWGRQAPERLQPAAGGAREGRREGGILAGNAAWRKEVVPTPALDRYRRRLHPIDLRE